MTSLRMKQDDVTRASSTLECLDFVFQQVYFANPHETQGVLRAAIHAIAQYIVVKLNEEN